MPRKIISKIEKNLFRGKKAKKWKMKLFQIISMTLVILTIFQKSDFNSLSVQSVPKKKSDFTFYIQIFEILVRFSVYYPFKSSSIFNLS